VNMIMIRCYVVVVIVGGRGRQRNERVSRFNLPKDTNATASSLKIVGTLLQQAQVTVVNISCSQL
jgi:hypothetical protein